MACPRERRDHRPLFIAPRLRRWLSAWVEAVPLAAAACAQAADVIADGELLVQNWTVVLSASGLGGSASSVRHASGGNPDAMRRVQISTSAAPNCCTQSTVFAVHLRAGYVYVPSARGALASIKVEQDARGYPGALVEQRTGPAVRQDGILYIAGTADTDAVLNWQPVSAGPHTRNDFFALDSADSINGIDESLQPNFSTSGSPIEVGFYRALASGTGGGLNVSDQGLDNVIITVTPAAVCPGDFNSDGVVNTADLTAMLARFGQAVTPGTAGDINGDGAVNTADLTTFLGRFGSSC